MERFCDFISHQYLIVCLKINYYWIDENRAGEMIVSTFVLAFFSLCPFLFCMATRVLGNGRRPRRRNNNKMIFRSSFPTVVP